MEGQARFLFFPYLMLIVWAPVPLGSNRPWSWTILEFGVISLLAAYFIIYAFGQYRLPEVIRKSKILILFLLGWVATLLVQIVPLPSHVMSLLSPTTLDIYTSIFPDMDRGMESISMDTGSTIAGLTKSFTYFALFLLTLILVHTKKRMRTLMITIVLAGVIQAIFGMIDAFKFQNYVRSVTWSEFYQPVTGSFVSKNHFAAYLNMVIACGLGLIIASGIRERRQKNKRERLRFLLVRATDWRVHMIVYLAILGIALLFTHSRGGWISLAVALMVAAIPLALSHTFKHQAMRAYSGLVTVVVVCMLVLGGDIILSHMSQAPEQVTGRTDIWKNSVEIIKSFPLLGTGAGTFEYVYPLYEHGEIDGYVNYVHNDYLQLLVEQGVIGFLLLGMAVLLCLRKGINAVISAESMSAGAYTLGVLIAIFTMLTHGVIDFNFYIPSNAAYFFVFLGLAVAAGYIQQEEHRLHHRHERRSGSSAKDGKSTKDNNNDDTLPSPA
jgi:O-antigen ligase